MLFQLSLLLLTTPALALTPATPPPVITLADGSKLTGALNSQESHWIYRGVPYAAPPIGDLRFRPPRPPSPWKGTPSFDKPTPMCMQTPSGWPTIDDAPGYSENCLTLNVYVPVASSNAACAASAMPVMVWLHGGDFQWGGHNDAEISSPPVTKASAHTIIVVPNYRLGAFGFLAADALRSRDGDGGSTGNYGLQDQRAAFAWARSNAASFGGDGGRITIYGESAGGGAVGVHLVAPKSWPTFDRGIGQSGAFQSWSTKAWADAVSNYEYTLGAVGCGSAVGDAAAVKCLLAVPAQKLMDVTQYDGDMPFGDTLSQCEFAPTVDGVELTASAAELLDAGTVHPTAELIIGSCSDEGTFFISGNNYDNRTLVRHEAGFYSGASLPRTIGAAQFKSWAMGTFGAATGRLVPEVYTVDTSGKGYQGSDGPTLNDQGAGSDEFHTFHSPWWAATRATGDYLMTCSARRTARTWEKRAGGDAPAVYTYLFAHAPIFSAQMANVGRWGAFHGADVGSVFFSEWELTGTAEKVLARAMIKYWTNFASSGDPNVLDARDEACAEKLVTEEEAGAAAASDANGPIRAVWPKYSAAEDVALNFAVAGWPHFAKTNIEARAGIRSTFCDFWDEVDGDIVNPASPGSQSAALLPEFAPAHAEVGKEPGAWAAAPALAHPRAALTLDAVGGALYAIGGMTGSSAALAGSTHAWLDVATCERFLPGATAWTKCASMPTARSNHASAVVHGKIHILGGVGPDHLSANSKGGNPGGVKTLATHLIYDPVADKWETRAPLPIARAGLAAVNGGASLVVFGGFEPLMWDDVTRSATRTVGATKETNRVFAYDASADAWSERKPMPAARTALSAARVGGEVITVGGRSLSSGFSVQETETVAAYDAAADAWTRRGTMPEPRAGSTMAAHAANGKLYVFGGSGPSGDIDVTEAYDVALDQWAKLAAMPTARHLAASAELGGQLYVVGGASLQLSGSPSAAASACVADPSLSTSEIFTPEGAEVAAAKLLSAQTVSSWGEFNSNVKSLTATSNWSVVVTAFGAGIAFAGIVAAALVAVVLVLLRKKRRTHIAPLAAAAAPLPGYSQL